MGLVVIAPGLRRSRLRWSRMGLVMNALRPHPTAALQLVPVGLGKDLGQCRLVEAAASKRVRAAGGRQRGHLILGVLALTLAAGGAGVIGDDYADLAHSRILLQPRQAGLLAGGHGSLSDSLNVSIPLDSNRSQASPPATLAVAGATQAQ